MESGILCTLAQLTEAQKTKYMLGEKNWIYNNGSWPRWYAMRVAKDSSGKYFLWTLEYLHYRQ